MSAKSEAVGTMIILIIASELRKLGIPVIEKRRIMTTAHNPNNLCNSKGWIHCRLSGGCPTLPRIFDCKRSTKQLSCQPSTTGLLMNNACLLEFRGGHQPNFIGCCSFKQVHF